MIPAKEQLCTGEGREEGVNKIEVSSQKNTEGKLGQEAKVAVGFQDEWEQTEQRKKDHLHLQVILERPKSTF